ncbi:hypothetical protein [Haladaptatus sp. CMSO5]|uniref:hypothetical protein n=1 Tax=Haladaptatus sp. CMSO5 TaxID=3120514 RepID=UPI002FCE5802
MNRSRREFLRIGTGGITAGLSGFAGCLDRLDSLPGTDEGDYRTWLPAPEAVGGERAYQFFRVRPAKTLEFEASLTEDAVEKLLAYGDGMEQLLGLDASEVNELIVGPPFRVGQTSVEQDAIRSELSAKQFNEQGTVDSFSIFTSEQAETAVGVADGTVISANTDDGSPQSIVEAVVETHGDSDAQYQTVNEAFGMLSEGLNNGHFLTGTVHQPHEQTAPEQAQFEGAVGWGLSRTFKKTESPGQWLIVFESEAVADEQAVKAWADASLADVNTVQVAQAGRTVLVTGKEPTEKLSIRETLPTVE